MVCNNTSTDKATKRICCFPGSSESTCGCILALSTCMLAPSAAFLHKQHAGPSFAKEVMMGRPTGIVAASKVTVLLCWRLIELEK